MAELPTAWDATNRIALDGRWITPGLIDCHTHLVYAGDRAHEFEQRLKGVTYEEISRQGGGIASTVNAKGEVTELLYDSFGELMTQRRYWKPLTSAQLATLRSGSGGSTAARTAFGGVLTTGGSAMRCSEARWSGFSTARKGRMIIDSVSCNRVSEASPPQLARSCRRSSCRHKKPRAAKAGGDRLSLAAFFKRPQAELKSAL